LKNLGGSSGESYDLQNISAGTASSQAKNQGHAAVAVGAFTFGSKGELGVPGVREGGVDAAPGRKEIA